MRWNLYRPFVLLLLVATWICLGGWAINPKGTSNAPVSVGTSTPVQISACYQQRQRIKIDNESASGSGNLFCAPGPPYPDCGAPGTTGAVTGVVTFAPTAAGAGVWIAPGASFIYNQAQGSTDLYPLSSQWSCVCSTGTCVAGWTEAPTP